MRKEGEVGSGGGGGDREREQERRGEVVRGRGLRNKEGTETNVLGRRL